MTASLRRGQTLIRTVLDPGRKDEVVGSVVRITGLFNIKSDPKVFTILTSGVRDEELNSRPVYPDREYVMAHFEDAPTLEFHYTRITTGRVPVDPVLVSYIDENGQATGVYPDGVEFKAPLPHLHMSEPSLRAEKAWKDAEALHIQTILGQLVHVANSIINLGMMYDNLLERRVWEGRDKKLRNRWGSLIGRDIVQLGERLLELVPDIRDQARVVLARPVWWRDGSITIEDFKRVKGIIFSAALTYPENGPWNELKAGDSLYLGEYSAEAEGTGWYKNRHLSLHNVGGELVLAEHDDKPVSKYNPPWLRGILGFQFLIRVSNAYDDLQGGKFGSIARARRTLKELTETHHLDRT